MKFISVKEDSRIYLQKRLFGLPGLKVTKLNKQYPEWREE